MRFQRKRRNGGMASSHKIGGPKSHRFITKRFRVREETSHDKCAALGRLAVEVVEDGTYI